MSDNIVPVVCKSISDDSKWFRVVWEVLIDGRNQLINSGYGPDFRGSFVESLRNLKIIPNQSSDLIGKADIHARIYKSRKDNKWKVAPDNIFERSSKISAATTVPLTHQPLANLANRMPAAPLHLSNPIEELKAAISQAKTVTTSPTPPPQPTVPVVSDKGTAPVVSAKSLAGFKGGDTKSLTVVSEVLGKFLSRDGLESRLSNPKLASDLRDVQISILQELAKRK